VAAVGNYGASGWQTYTHTASESGELTVGMASTNWRDGALDPHLLIDNVVHSGATAGLTLDADGTIVATPDESHLEAKEGSFSYTITEEGVSEAATVTIKGEDSDTLWGTSGNDIMVGRGDDWLYGVGGDDILVGGSGGVVEGGQGNDTLIGGTGADKFVFQGGDGSDVVQNFGEKDTLVFEGISGIGSIDLDDLLVDDAPVYVGALDFSRDATGDLVIGTGSGDNRTEVTLDNQTTGSGYSISENEDGVVVTLDD